MLKCVVIDDEPLALNIITDYVRRYGNMLVVEATTKPWAGLQRIQQNEVDLVFLDINMPGISGLQIMELTGNRCKVILTTAYSEFAIQGFEHDAVDYLLKPISYERFCKAMKKLEKKEGQVNELSNSGLFVKSEYKLVRIEFTDILFLESMRDYVCVHLSNGTRVMTLQSLSNFEKELPPAQFLRVHKSFIIAINQVSSYEKKSLNIRLKSIPVGNTYRENLQRLLGS